MRIVTGFLGIFLLSSALADTQPTCVSWPSSVFSPRLNAAGKAFPDYGLYWLRYNPDTNGEEARRAYTPSDYAPYFSDGTPNVNPNPAQDDGVARGEYDRTTLQGFYDPTKPTIIFFHGWQASTTLNQHRIDFCYSYPLDDKNTSYSPLVNTLKFWQGWNVAVFYWNQFADESNVNDAEAKLYSSSANQAMRWAYAQDGNAALQYCSAGQATCAMPFDETKHVKTVADLAYEAVVNGVPSRGDHELRIAGQSLGAQLAILVSDRLAQQNQNTLMPTQLILLDPYFSLGTLNNLFNGKTVAGHANDFVKDLLNDHVAVLEYRTSLLSHFPFGDWNDWLMSHSAYMRLYPTYLTNLDGMALSAQQHRSSIYLYFESQQAPPIWDASTPSTWNASYINAQSSTDQVLKMMNEQRYQQTGLGEAHFEDTGSDVFSNSGSSND